MPQESYPGFQRQEINNSTSLRNSNKTKLSKKLLLILLAIPALIIFIILWNTVLSPAFFPNDIRGDLIDLTFIPGNGSSPGRLWIQTDGSFSYISKSTSAGSQSISRKGLFCKTYSYVYDPIAKKVLTKIKTPYDNLPPRQKVYFKEGKVWVVSQEDGGKDAEVNVYDPQSGALLTDNKNFLASHKELSSGMERIIFGEDQNELTISTHDGKTFSYSVSMDKLYPNSLELSKAGNSPDTKVTLFQLGREENNSKRKVLYKVTGSYETVVVSKVSESQLKGELPFIQLSNNAEASLLTPGRVYLEGIILYQDAELAVILHQDKIGKSANRLLTCVDTSGKEKWTVNQDLLFSDMAVREEDSFSEIFFMKSKIKMERSGNTVILKFTPSGVIAFDTDSGKKMWELDI